MPTLSRPVDIADAKARLPERVERASHGEVIVLARALAEHRFLELPTRVEHAET